MDLPIRTGSYSNQPSIYYQQEKIVTHKEEQKETLSPFVKRILIVDNDSDITVTFKQGLETDKVCTYN